MFATNTRPRPMTLTASTRPVTAVSVNSAGISGLSRSVDLVAVAVLKLLRALR